MNTIGAVVGHVLWALFSCLVKVTLVAGATLVTYGALVVVSPSLAVNAGLSTLVALLAAKYLFFAQSINERPDNAVTDTTDSGAFSESDLDPHDDPHYNRNLDPRYDDEVTNVHHNTYKFMRGEEF